MYMETEGKHKNKMGKSSVLQKDFQVTQNNFLKI